MQVVGVTTCMCSAVPISSGDGKPGAAWRKPLKFEHVHVVRKLHHLDSQLRCICRQVIAVVTGLQLDAMTEAELVIKNFGSRIKVVRGAHCINISWPKTFVRGYDGNSRMLRLGNM